MQRNISHPTCRSVSKSWDVLVVFHSLWKLSEERVKKLGKCGSGKNGQNKVGGKCIFAVNQFSRDKKLRSCLLANVNQKSLPSSILNNQCMHKSKSQFNQGNILFPIENITWTALPVFLESLKGPETNWEGERIANKRNVCVCRRGGFPRMVGVQALTGELGDRRIWATNKRIPSISHSLTSLFSRLLGFPHDSQILESHSV